ncbi:hypothetical protein GGR55DRAFT_572560 [Xylaria sp. FL0064]|nr:hypothetical protein GGR55DRAFT_572560 [Xylaria sp. FL0064]
MRKILDIYLGVDRLQLRKTHLPQSYMVFVVISSRQPGFSQVMCSIADVELLPDEDEGLCMGLGDTLHIIFPPSPRRYVAANLADSDFMGVIYRFSQNVTSHFALLYGGSTVGGLILCYLHGRYSIHNIDIRGSGSLALPASYPRLRQPRRLLKPGRHRPLACKRAHRTGHFGSLRCAVPSPSHRTLSAYMATRWKSSCHPPGTPDVTLWLLSDGRIVTPWPANDAKNVSSRAFPLAFGSNQAHAPLHAAKLVEAWSLTTTRSGASGS